MNTAGTAWTCKTCLNDSYPGGQDGPPPIYACVPCPHRGMIYDKQSKPWLCECDETNGWKTAGAVCVATSISDQITATHTVESAR